MNKLRLAFLRNNPRKYICRCCAGEFEAFPMGRHWYCDDCGHALYAAQRVAKNWIALAIRSGVLMRADAFRCVDCDQWATDWEHRDYDKPLAVEPTCASCNFLRGPAVFTRVALS